MGPRKKSKKVRAVWDRRRYKERREEALRLMGNKCAWCGSLDALEIDHIVPREVSGRPRAANWHTLGKARFLEEVKQCQLLCHDCHKRKTDDMDPEVRFGQSADVP